MVFFFDEAHLLFNDMPKALLQKVEQIVKLIRSKGVGVYFVTQVPTDIPDSVLSQLGNKVQHALRAYTPKEQKAVRAAAQSFRVNPDFDTEKTLGELGTGEALISFLDEEGVPGIVQRAYILPPRSCMDVAGEEEIKRQIQTSPLCVKYDRVLDRESAYEMLKEKAQRDAYAAEEERRQAELEKERIKLEQEAEKQAQREAEKQKRAFDRAVGNVSASAGRSVGREMGKSLGKELDKKMGGGKFFTNLFGNAASSAGGSLARGI